MILETREWSDEALVAGLREDDPLAQGAFVRQYAGLVWDVVHNAFARAAGLPAHFRDRDAQEEVVQDACVRVFSKISSYDPNKAAFSTWVYVVTYRLALDTIRSHSRHAPAWLLEYTPRDHGAVSAAPDQAQARTAWDMALERIREFHPQYAADLSVLSAQLKLLREGKTPTLRAVGEQLGINASTVKRREDHWRENGFLDLVRRELERAGMETGGGHA